jgi:hypothetical protein
VARRVIEVLRPAATPPGHGTDIALASGRCDEALHRAMAQFGFANLVPLGAHAG